MWLKGLGSGRVVRIVSIVILCGTLALVGSAFFNKGHGQVLRDRDQTSSETVKTENKTKAFSIIRSTRRGEIVEVEFRNDYKKPITGFLVGVGGGATIQTELLVGDEIKVMDPGATTLAIYGVTEKLEASGIVVLAVLFNDHTGDGDPGALHHLLEYRNGMRLQRQQTIQALQGVLSLSDGEMPKGLEKLISDGFSPSEDDLKRFPIPVQLGVKDERRRLLRMLATVKTANEGTGVPPTEALAFLRTKLTSVVRGYSQTIDSL